MLKNVIFFIFSGLLMFISHIEAAIVRRAAFDFGSGEIRIHVADVDTEKQVVVKTLYLDSVRLFLSDDLAKRPDQKFSEEIQQEALATAEKFKSKAIEYGAAQF